MRASDAEKASELGGFSFKFSKSFWPIFKYNSMALFHSFNSSGEFDPRFSESFISLISKVKSPMFLNDFQPIPLLGLVHKLIAKVLTRRLQSFISQLVNHSQFAFIRGCNI